jgi:hypothetical protein
MGGIGGCVDLLELEAVLIVGEIPVSRQEEGEICEKRRKIV